MKAQRTVSKTMFWQFDLISFKFLSHLHLLKSLIFQNTNLQIHFSFEKGKNCNTEMVFQLYLYIFVYISATSDFISMIKPYFFMLYFYKIFLNSHSTMRQIKNIEKVFISFYYSLIRLLFFLRWQKSSVLKRYIFYHYPQTIKTMFYFLLYVRHLENIYKCIIAMIAKRYSTFISYA